MIELFRRHETGAGIGGLHPKDPVELGRMAARFVDLQPNLARVQDQRLDPTRTLDRREQGHGLLADALAVLVELQGGDELEAAGPLVPSEGVRVRAALHVIRRGGGRLDARTAFIQVLLRPGPLR